MSSKQPSQAAYVSDAALRRLLAGVCNPALAFTLVQTRAGVATVSRQHVAPAARPISALRGTIRAGQAKIARLTDAEMIRTTTLQTLTSAGLVGDPAQLATPARALAEAQGVEATRAAAETYLATAQTAHMDLMIRAATVAVRRAAAATGLATIEVRQPRQGVMRVFAADAQGAGIATELRVERGELALESEVVGVAEPACAAVLERFNAALDAEGVRLRRGPIARTRGKATSAAARDFEANPPMAAAGRREAAPLARAGARAQARPRQRA